MFNKCKLLNYYKCITLSKMNTELVTDKTNIQHQMFNLEDQLTVNHH